MRSIIISLLLASILVPRISRADFFLHHWEDHYEPLHSITLEGDLSYYMSNQNYDPQANTVSVFNSNSYKRFEIDGLGQFGLMDRISLFGRMNWAHIEADNSQANGSSDGLADQSVGGDFRVYESPPSRSRWMPSSLDLQAQVDFPAYDNTNVNSALSPYLGDQSVDVTVGGFFSIPVWQDEERSLSIIAGSGYTFRSSHFSPQVPWTITASTVPKDSGFVINVSVFGTTSLKNDTTYPIPMGLSTGSGGSFITDAINPALIVLRGQAGYQLDPKSQILVAFEQSLWGENSPNGENVIGAFRYSFGAESKETSAYEKANTGAVSYSLDAKVLKANDRLNLVKINKGFDQGVAKGQVFDIFSVGADGNEGEAIARAHVTEVKSEEAALTVIEYFKEQWINEGFVAKRLVQ